MTTFSFTAFTEDDLGGHVGCGTKFTMPASATTCITVKDNDGSLSGDWRDRALDKRGQTADIEVGHEEVGNGGQIYAESYYWAKGSDGQWYVLIEIEQEGSNDDYFTFYTGHGYDVPDAGVELHVVSKCNVKGNWVVYDKLDAGEKDEKPEFRECDDPDAVLLDFEGFAAGTVVDDEYNDLGVTITAQRDRSNTAENDAMVFDSANPTGGDTDLATDTQGNVLIISEDNDSSDPDDAIGGVITFTFDNPSFIYDLKVLDTEEGGVITLKGADGAVIATFDIPKIGDGDIAQVLLDTDGVTEMTIELNGSGAVDDLCFVPGEPQLGALSGRYFCDENRDDIDNAEPGVAGKLVTLLTVDGEFVAETRTNDNGDYRFDDLEPGDYVVMFESSLAEGKDFVAANAGNDDAVDSDVIDFENGKTAPVTVVAGEETKDVDAGVEEVDPLTGQIGDTVWLDVYGDGVLNDGALDPFFSGVEQGVPGVTVQLKDVNGTVLAEQVTDADGKYLFTGLAGGDYVVGFILPDGFEFTAQDAGSDDARDSDADRTTGMTDVISLPPGGSNLTVDAGLLRCGLIQGTSQSDENSPVGGYDLLVGCETDDTIRALSGEDILIGNGGNDLLDASTFDDILDGGAGMDTLLGGSENDVLTGGADDDVIDGGSERDVAVFGGDFADATITIVDVFTRELQVVSVDGTDIVRNVEVLRFDDGDVLVDALVPGGSADAVAAPAAGGAVNVDVLANDIELSEGTLSVVEANDGGFGSVVVEADGTVTYTAGADFKGYDFFTYTVSNGVGFTRTVEVQVGELPRPDASDPATIVLADALGTDGATFNGTDDAEIVLGGIGYDRINVFGGDDIVDGGKGNDIINAGGDNDLILGGEGNDGIQGRPGTDALFGELGDDLLQGTDGQDTMFGGEGDDRFRGQSGDDFMSGGAGNDRFLSLDAGADVALGGSGDDAFQWAEFTDAGARDFLDGESGVDSLTITIEATTDAVAVQAEVDAYLALVAANQAPGGSISDGSVLTGTFSFTTLDLDIRNIESVDVVIG